MVQKNADPVNVMQAESTNPTDDGELKGAADSKNILRDNKGKLAIGVAATLGVMIFYKWKEKNLPKDDPEGYARLQKLKNLLKEEDEKLESGLLKKNASPVDKQEIK